MSRKTKSDPVTPKNKAKALNEKPTKPSPKIRFLEKALAKLDKTEQSVINKHNRTLVKIDKKKAKIAAKLAKLGA